METKLMFLNKRLITGKTIQVRANKINKILIEVPEMKEEELLDFSKKYEINLKHLKNSISYFSKEKGEQIYKWCLAFDKKNLQI